MWLPIHADVADVVGRDVGADAEADAAGSVPEASAAVSSASMRGTCSACIDVF